MQHDPTGAAQPSALHQLPSPPSDFVGREAELAELRGAATADGRIAILGLRGIGGVGKTALALKLAEELAPRYPDGQIFLDLQGVKTQQDVTAPLSPAQAMAHVIRSFLPEARVPEDGAELAGLYRSVLHGRRVLLLMDNAAGREQVEPLIPPAGCALLVTSRIHFHLPGEATRDLGALPEADARALLLGIAPRIGEEAEEIARLCGRLPFALRLAGAALAENPALSPTGYIGRLATARRRFKEVDASLALSYELLREELRPLWCRLAVFPGTFDGAAVAAVWSLEKDAAEDALGELLRSSLVEWEDGRGRLHDLARLFAGERLTEADRAEAQRRHAAHYRDVLGQADGLYKQGGPAFLAALKLFDLEWGNVQAGQTWAAARAAEDDEAADLCSDYPSAGTFCLDLRLHPRERIRWREAALEAARRKGDRQAESVHLGNLGIAYAHLGEPRRAIGFYEQQLAIARKIGDRAGEAEANWNLGLVVEAEEDLERAVALMQVRVDYEREIGHPDAEAHAARVEAIRARLPLAP